MLMRKYLFVILICLAMPVSGQINYSRTDWIVKVNVLSPFDGLTFPVPQVGVERMITRYVSISAEGGYQLYGFKKPDTSFVDPRGFKANLELRYYIRKLYKTPRVGRLESVYVGFRPFFNRNRYSDDLSFCTSEDESVWHDDSYTTRNTTYGLNIVMGFQKAANKSIVFDLHFGAGVMMRDITNGYISYDREAGDVLAGSEMVKFFKGLGLEHSSGIYPNLVAGFRVGFRL